MSLAQTTTPMFTLNTPMHTAKINRISTDKLGKYILTCSDDKTAKLWNAKTGALIKTFRPPISEGDEGMLYAGAISPDGKTVAIGGLTGYEWDKTMAIYIFDVTSNTITSRITGLPNVIVDIEFSPDGNYLAVTLGGKNGIRIYSNFQDLTLVKSFTDYDAHSYNATFDNSGRLATVCFDGKIRLYSNTFELVNEFETTTGKQPFSLAYSPDGSLLAVGYNDSYKVEVRDGKTLKLLYEPDVTGANTVSSRINKVSFSYDGQYLMAGGAFQKKVNNKWWRQIRVWKNQGKGTYADYSAGLNLITDIKPIASHVQGGEVDFIFSSSKPDFGRMKIDGTNIFYNDSETNDYSAKDKTHFKINNDASEIGITPLGGKALAFSITNRNLSGFENQTGLTSYTDSYSGITLTDWYDSYSPKINYKPTSFLKTNERNKSVDISKNAKKIVFGADWFIYCTDASGTKLWEVPIQGTPFNVNISDDDKIVAAAFSDGTIRWYSMADGTLLMSLYLHPDNKRWVLWSPDGYFDCTIRADELIGWHVNQGANKEALYYPASQYYEQFYTPGLGAKILAGVDYKSFNKLTIKDMKLPPLVKIISPNSDIRGFKPVNNVLQSEKQIIEVTVEVTDQGGGIDEIVLFHSGKLVETTNRGYKLVVQNQSKSTKTFTITLVNGENRIRASAFNNQRTQAIADEITINYSGAQTVKSNLYLLVIGIDNYKNPQYKLNYAVADALAFKTEIEKGSKNIFGSVNVTYLTDLNASKLKITETFNSLSSTIKQNDVFIMYYAGHGVMSVEDKPHFYIIPYDITQLYGDNNILKNKAISAAEIQNFSMTIKAQKQLFILDACQSGGMTEHIAARGQEEEKAIAVLARSTGTYWFSASGSEQFATEFAQIGHGVYTFAILLGLQGQADAGSKDKQITVQELDVFIKEKVPELSEKYKGQSQYPKSYGGGDDFPLIIIK